MTTLLLHFHSFVDVITNSSTVIYCQCTNGTITTAKKLVDSILKASKSNKTADDLFEFRIVGDKDYELDRICDALEDKESVAYKEFKKLVPTFDLEKYLSLSWSEKEASKEKVIFNNTTDAIFEKMNNKQIARHDNWGLTEEYGYNTEKLEMKAKDGSEIGKEIVSALHEIFDYDGHYDG